MSSAAMRRASISQAGDGGHVEDDSLKLRKTEAAPTAGLKRR